MKTKTTILLSLLATVFFILTSWLVPMKHKPAAAFVHAAAVKHYLYVAVPGIRDYLGYGGHGILVFDIDNHHRFVKRIQTKGFHPDHTPSNVKGIAVSIPLNSIFISTIESLQRIDLTTDKLIWEKTCCLNTPASFHKINTFDTQQPRYELLKKQHETFFHSYPFVGPRGWMQTKNFVR